jgi:hypothetical protein
MLTIGTYAHKVSIIQKFVGDLLLASPPSRRTNAEKQNPTRKETIVVSAVESQTTCLQQAQDTGRSNLRVEVKTVGLVDILPTPNLQALSTENQSDFYDTLRQWPLL